MKTMRVYDLPTRTFHWLFVVLFLGAFLIAKNFDDDSAIYPYHMLAGLTIISLVVLRVIWGFVGSRYARFGSFALRPSDLIRYMRSLISQKTETHLGHNPASSWAAIAFICLALGLAVTGVLMAQEINKEFFEDIHELFANGFIILAISHVLGIALHTWRHKDRIALSMIHGRKRAIDGEIEIEKNHTAAGILTLLLTLTFALYLLSRYDSTQRRLNLWGANLQLGETEEGQSPEEDAD